MLPIEGQRRNDSVTRYVEIPCLLKMSDFHDMARGRKHVSGFCLVAQHGVIVQNDVFPPDIFTALLLWLHR